ncbi:MAG: C-terminal binding protein [Chloroflexi bacterium]|nr:C-terminal binding protein [Chloroflexota bacterium]
MHTRPVVVGISLREPGADLSEERAAVEAAGGRLVAFSGADEQSLLAGLREVDIVLNRAFNRYDARILGQMERCRAIVQPSTGYDLIDVDAATERRILVINLPFQCVDEVANHALALILALNRKLDVAQARVRAGDWNPRALLPIGPITGETLGLLGFGNIARATGERARALKMNVLAYDPYVDPSIARSLGVELVALDELLRRSDYISCHLPLNPRTHHLISEAQFRQMKPSAIFVNTARGGVVDEAALVRALQNGWIAAAGLDVLEKEPPDPTNPLLHMENVIVTPHLAGTSNATPLRNRRQAIAALVAYIKGERPDGLVNPSVWERARAGLSP